MVSFSVVELNKTDTSGEVDKFGDLEEVGSRPTERGDGFSAAQGERKRNA